MTRIRRGVRSDYTTDLCKAQSAQPCSMPHADVRRYAELGAHITELRHTEPLSEHTSQRLCISPQRNLYTKHFKHCVFAKYGSSLYSYVGCGIYDT